MPLLLVCRWLAGRPTAGALDDARTILLALERAAAQIGGPETEAALSEARGALALSEGAPDRAVELFRRAADGWQTLGRPYDQIRTLTDLGQALALVGGAVEARAAFDQALRLVESLAAQLDAAELKASFLNSPLVQELRSALSTLPAAPPFKRAPQDGPCASHRMEQQIRFCTAPDGVHIAYATVGAGPVLVKAANWLSHLEFDWNSPVWRHWLTGLAQRHTLVRYDERGCGLSDWDVKDFSVDAWVRDLETVVDTLGLEHFPLLGISQGGPVAIAYAVRHPERVSHLILYGSYARGKLKRDPQQGDEAELYIKLAEVGWGKANPAFRQVFATTFIPGGALEQLRWFDELQRMATSPENAVRFLRAFYQIDVSHLAPKVTAPTMVLHAHEDGRIPFDAGRDLAALIPGARFVPLESKNHILLESEPAWQRFLDEVHQFLGSS